MQYVRLGEVIQSAKSERCGDDNYPVLSITKSDGVVLQSEKFKKRIASQDTSSYKVVRFGQLVQGIHIDEANFGIQDIVNSGIVSPAYKIWDVNATIIHPKYLEEVLRSPRSIQYYSSNFNGSIKRRERLSDKDFLAMEIPCPLLEEQNYVLSVIRKLRGIISVRQQELLKLDELIKARFVEMFGDPADDSREDKVEISEICEKITDGEHGSVARVPNGHPFLNAKHILKNGKIDWDTITFVADEDHQRIYKRCNPEEGDILLTTTGTIGNVAIMPKSEEVSMDRGITLLKIDRQKVTSEFVAVLLKQPSIQMQMGVNVHASAIGHLFMNKVKKLPAVLPSMERQVEFSCFVKQVDKSKVAA